MTDLVQHPLILQGQIQQDDDNPKVWRVALFLLPLGSEQEAAVLLERLGPIIAKAIYGEDGEAGGEETSH